MTPEQANQIIQLLQHSDTMMSWILGFTVGIWIMYMMDKRR